MNERLEPAKRNRPRATRVLGALCLIVVTLSLALGAYHKLKPMPPGTDFQGTLRPATNVTFLADTSWIDQAGDRQVEQTIFDEVLRIIDQATDFVLLDMFLFNDFQGEIPELTRPLSEEITSALIRQRDRHPTLNVVVITDPVNELYGGMESHYLARLREAGIRVVTTDLNRLRDSNPLYSGFWRLLVKPFGNTRAETVANPLGPGRVSLRSYLKLLNFKANHRKVIAADLGDSAVALVSSANPHDGSSAHRNAAIRFTGPAVADLVTTENAVLRLSGAPQIELDLAALQAPATPGSASVQVVTERKIKRAILNMLSQAAAGDRVQLMMFYLADRDVVAALLDAHRRAVDVRVLLDPNRDAFGREKNGIPNRQSAHELAKAGIPVRWCSTAGEQCHAKLLLLDHAQGSTLLSGSANFTRRNLSNYNLETDVVVRGGQTLPVFTAVRAQFELEWGNADGRRFSLPYEQFADPSLWRRGLYRVMEWSGLSTF
ncbi:MAG: phospholipase D family protein [Pseudomonadota bacterium]